MPGVYDVPVFKRVKVHRDFHAEVAKALYSLPECWIGQYLDVRADTELVKFYRRGVLVKVHPRQLPVGAVLTLLICPSTRPATPCVTSRR
nr:hypothetical protein [Mycolicibacterium agri]